MFLLSSTYSAKAQGLRGFYGTEFWLSFPNNIIKVYDSSLYIMVYSTSNDVVTIHNPRTGYKLIKNTQANKYTKMTIPRAQWEYPTPVAGAQDAGVVITSNNDIMVTAVNSESTSGEMTQLLPVQYLEFGQNYTLAYPTFGVPGKEAQFVVVALDEGNTTVRVKSTSYIQSFSYNFTVTMKKGQAMPLYITDTSKPNPIVNVTVEGSCKRIAVFTSIKSVENGNGSSCSGTDMLFEQAWPNVYFGKQYVVPSVPENLSSSIQITALFNNSTVTWDGAPLTVLQAGQTYKFEIGNNQDHLIDCNNPVQVNQTTFSHGCSGHPNLVYGDPSLLNIAPVANGVNKTALVTLTDQLYRHYLKITCKGNSVPNVTVNGVPLNPSGGWKGYSWGGQNYYTAWQLMPANGSYQVESDGPIQAYYYAMAFKSGLSTCIGGGFINRNSDFLVDKTQVCDTFESFNFTAVGDSVNNILWNFGDGNTANTNPVNHSYSKSGIYKVKLLSYRTNAFCQADTIEKTVRVVKRHPEILFGDSFPCVGTAVKINITAQSGNTYVWKDGFGTLDRTILQNSKLHLIITDSNGCVTNDSMEIKFKECNFQHLKIANIFTPNRDGLNDKWVIDHLGYKEVNVTIHNRWGQLIYSYSLPTDTDWNGTIGNKGFTLCPDGTYYYTIVAINQYDKSVSNINGIIQLIR